MARPRQVSDEQILAQMRRVVLAHGPSASLDLVAQALEVSAPALLKRFGSRQALLLAALRPPKSPEWINHVSGGPTDQPLRKQLLDVFTQMADFMDEAVPCVTVLRESGIPSEEIFEKKSPVRGFHALQRWLKLARRKGLVTATELDAAAYAILGAIQSRAFFNHMMNIRFSKVERARYLSELSDLFTRCLCPARTQRSTPQPPPQD